MARVVRRAAAEEDLIESYAFIGMDDLGAADRFLVSARETIARLAESPRVGRLREFADPRLREIRSWPVHGFENWLILYRPMRDGIEVLRVLHGARDLEVILGETESGPADEPEENT